ncbi:hypothetical protein, partial [[Clostridium] symbiosum]|uniref:hypothetical protein n=2 Tax=Clostridium symbiosum TaxID=1512 RepID=UPI0034A10271
IVRARSAEQSGIKGVKRPFDPNIMTLAVLTNPNLSLTFFTKPMEICRKMLYNTFQKAQQRRTK